MFLRADIFASNRVKLLAEFALLGRPYYSARKKMIRSVIESVGTYLPEAEVTTKTVLDGCRRHILLPLERWSGISSRRMAGTTEFAVDLAERAVARCLEKSRHAARDVELLICCNISKQDESDRSTLEPTTSTTLLTRFDFGPLVHFDIANACAGMFTGILLADSLIRQRVFSRVLVVSGEYITHLTKTAQKEIESSRDSRLACLTLGDAAAAVMLEATSRPGIGFQQLELRSAPEHSGLCIAKTTHQEHGGGIMFTDSTGLNDHATSNAVLHALATFQDCQMKPEEIDHFILHQTSRRALRGGSAAFNKALGRTAMHVGNVVDNLTHRGNTASTSHFVALADLIQTDRIHSGDQLLFCVQASGITYGTAVYKLDDLPARLRNGHGNGSSRTAALASAATEAASAGSPAVKPAMSPVAAPAASPAATSAQGLAPTFQRLSRRVRVESAATVLPEQPTETETEMATRAAKDCLARSKYSASEIDTLIFTGIYRRDFLCEPAVATLVAKELGITGSMQPESRGGFFAFDVLNGALGGLTAAWVLSNLIAGGQAKVAMLVSAESIQQQEEGPALGVVDAASAMILDAGDGATGFDSFSFASFPEHHDVFRSYAITATGPAKLGIRGGMDKLRQVAIPELRRLMDRHLQETGLTRDDLSAVLPPQGSDEFIAQLAICLGMPAGRVVNAGSGNVFASSFAFGLLSPSRQDSEKPLLALEFAAGLQVGCATYYGAVGTVPRTADPSSSSAASSPRRKS
jgi:3-oxoacyl-[acyl-carrier-protein] synthase III